MKVRGFSVLLIMALFSGVAYGAQFFTRANHTQQPGDAAQATTRKLVIKYKPNPGYTREARRNGTEGRVVLRVEFKADGEIGSVEPVEGLPDGLTEEAVEAARRIRFEPELRDGQPVSKKLHVVYMFRLH
jgi:TonB family protein